jgi:uncharacterized protein YjbI with pentapeptide repeats
MPTKNAQFYGRIALRTGPLLVESYTDRKRLRLNGEVTEENITKLLDEAKARGIPIDLNDRNLTNLKDAKLFVGRNLSYSSLIGIKSTGLDFSGVILFNAKLIRAIIPRSAFANTDVTEADVWNADFSFGLFVDVIGLEKAKNLGTAKFYGARLSDAQKAIILKVNPNAKFGYT